MNSPYFPAAKGLPSIITSVENSIVVFSLAPALHGAALLLPKPWSVYPTGINCPQIFPSRPLTPGRLYSMVTSVMPTRSPTRAFLFPPLGRAVRIICEKQERTRPNESKNADSFFIQKVLCYQAKKEKKRVH